METTCPVFRPTVEEFADFQKYVEYIERESTCGIVKVIPPQGWFERKYDMKPDWVVATPVQQEVFAHKAGVYQVVLHEQKDMTYQAFVEYDMKNSFVSDNFEEREREFWQYMGNRGKYADPIYGADMSASLFGDHDSAWNLKRIKTPLKLIEGDLPGVTSPMLYVGTWRAMFCYHTEDLDLYSINYLHTGAPKSWYSIPISYRQRFESFMQGQFSLEFQTCHEYLRHKNSMISKSQLKCGGISYDTVIQMPGEFVITFPGAYHAGFNHGLNIAEATNFCTPSWIPIGRQANICLCQPNTVKIDMDYFETLLLRDYVHNGMEVTLVRCCCGVRKESTMPDLPKCAHCGAQYHNSCVIAAIPDAIGNECHVCASIRIRDAEENAVLTEKEAQRYDDELQAKELYFREHPLKIKTQLSVRMFPPMGSGEPPCWVQGHVVDISDDSFRFHPKHVKGSRRFKDVWLTFNSFARYAPFNVTDDTGARDSNETKKRRKTAKLPRAKRMTTSPSHSSAPLLLDPSIFSNDLGMSTIATSINMKNNCTPSPTQESYDIDDDYAFLPENSFQLLLQAIPTREQAIVGVVDDLYKQYQAKSLL